MANSSIYNALYGNNTLKGGAITKDLNNFMKLLNTKKEFLVLVFANLIVQLGITYYIMQKTNNPKINIWILFVFQLFIIYLITMIPMPPFLKFIVFCAFSYLFGLIFSPLKENIPQQLIIIAIQSALSIFGLMLASGVALIISGIKLTSNFGMSLFLLLLALIIGRLVLMLTSVTIFNKVLSFFSIMLFAVYVLYDTNIILQRNYYGDFITASMDYYLDILNLFVNLLDVFGDR